MESKNYNLYNSVGKKKIWTSEKEPTKDTHAAAIAILRNAYAKILGEKPSETSFQFVELAAAKMIEVDDRIAMPSDIINDEFTFIVYVDNPVDSRASEDCYMVAEKVAFSEVDRDYRGRIIGLDYRDIDKVFHRKDEDVHDAGEYRCIYLTQLVNDIIVFVQCEASSYEISELAHRALFHRNESSINKACAVALSLTGIFYYDYDEKRTFDAIRSYLPTNITATPKMLVSRYDCNWDTINIMIISDSPQSAGIKLYPLYTRMLNTSIRDMVVDDDGLSVIRGTVKTLNSLLKTADIKHALTDIIKAVPTDYDEDDYDDEYEVVDY